MKCQLRKSEFDAFDVFLFFLSVAIRQLACSVARLSGLRWACFLLIWMSKTFWLHFVPFPCFTQENVSLYSNELTPSPLREV